MEGNGYDVPDGSNIDLYFESTESLTMPFIIHNNEENENDQDEEEED